MKISNFICLILLTACAQTTEITTPSGARGYAIDCNSNFSSISECYKKASEVCPGGYYVDSKDKDEHIAFRSLIITCKGLTQKQAQEAEMLNSEPVSNDTESELSCMNTEDCRKNEVCATIRGEYPGSCVKKGLGL